MGLQNIFINPVGVAEGWLNWSIGQYGIDYRVDLGGSDKPDDMFSSSRSVGQRLQDQKITSSAYGTPIPKAFGTVRLAGNMIWYSGFEETEHQQKTVTRTGGGSGGGKGGGGSAQPVVWQTHVEVTYTYKTNVAIAFCMGEATHVTRIWFDSNLVYKSVYGTARGSKDNFKFKFYPGSETQNIDSTISSFESINTPAHRGLCYIVFKDLELEDYGNRIPNITAEINFNSTAARTNSAIESTNGKDYLLREKDRPFVYALGSGANTAKKYDLSTQTFKVGSGDLGITVTAERSDIDDDGYIYLGDADKVYKIDQNSLSKVTIDAGAPTVLSVKAIDFPAFGADHSRWLIVLTNDDRVHLVKRDGMTLENTLQVPAATLDSAITQDSSGYVYVIGSDTGPTAVYLYRLVVVPDVIVAGATTFKIIVDRTFDVTSDGITSGMVFNGADNSLILSGAVGGVQTIYKFDLETLTVTLTEDETGIGGKFLDKIPSMFQWPQKNQLMGFASVTGVFSKINLSDFSVESTYDIDSYPGGQEPTGPDVAVYAWDDLTDSIYFTFDDASAWVSVMYLNRYTSANQNLTAVIDQLMTIAGVAGADYDTTDLIGETVRGYVLGGRTTVRNALITLAQRYSFDVVESDYKLKFVAKKSYDYSSPPDFYANFDEVGYVTGDESSNGVLFEPQRIQEKDLPKRVEVSHSDVGNKYQTSTQIASRAPSLITSVNLKSIELPLADTATAIAEYADKVLFMAWIERFMGRWSCAQKFLTADPGDVFLIGPRDEYTDYVTEVDFDEMIGIMRVSTNTISPAFLNQFDGVAVDAIAYTASSQAAGGETLNQFNDTITFPGPSECFPLDINLLRDSDSLTQVATGVYVAAGAHDSNWVGAVLYSSPRGTAYNQVGAVYESIWGVAQDALPAPASDICHVTWDRDNTVTVYLEHGSLASVSEDLVRDGQNMAVLGNFIDGWEIIGFADVLDNGDDTYTLSNLLRGRRGTELKMDGHAIGDYFIIVSYDTVERVIEELAEIGTTNYYQAISLNAGVDGAPARGITIEGNALKPYSPCYVKGSRDGSNNLTITWIRRSRFRGTMYGGDTIPLGEASEEYEIDILDGSDNVLRTIEDPDITYSADPFSDGYNASASYTAAQQTTDGLTPGDPIKMRIYQISSIIGRGYKREVTI